MKAAQSRWYVINTDNKLQTRQCNGALAYELLDKLRTEKAADDLSDKLGLLGEVIHWNGIVPKISSCSGSRAICPVGLAKTKDRIPLGTIKIGVGAWCTHWCSLSYSTLLFAPN